MTSAADSGTWDVNAFNAKVIEEFRANGGEVRSLPATTRLLLLTTTGARSGQKRTSPLGYLVAEERYYINGAVRGAPKHPAWYYNLVAHPDVTIEIGSDAFEATARVLQGDERLRIWNRFVARLSDLATWQSMAQRAMPIIELTRQR